jgi:manganese/zinc/iron transport system substrate-binding protein
MATIRILLCLAALFATRAVAAGGAPSLDVICTTGMIADAARNIAGDRAEVAALMGEGVDPHLYKATRSDIAALRRADVVLYNGRHLEGKMTEALERAQRAGRLVRAVAEAGEVDHDDPLALDPHVWMDPVAWRDAVLAVRDALVEADPDGAEVYAANAERYAERLAVGARGARGCW